MRDVFLQRCPDFDDFERQEGTYWETERRYKDDIISKVQALVASTASNEEVGRPLYEAMMPNQGPLLRWQTRDEFDRNLPQLGSEFFGIIGELARSKEPTDEAIFRAATNLQALRERGASILTPGEISAIAFTTAAAFWSAR